MAESMKLGYKDSAVVKVLSVEYNKDTKDIVATVSVDIPKISEDNIQKTTSEIKVELVEYSCSMPVLVQLMEQGLSFVNIYKYKSGEHLSTYIISIHDCRGI